MKALPAGLDHLLTEYNVGNGFADRNPGWACGLLPCSSHSPPGRGAGGAKRLLFPYQAFPCSEGASLPGAGWEGEALGGLGLDSALQPLLSCEGWGRATALGWAGVELAQPSGLGTASSHRTQVSWCLAAGDSPQPSSVPCQGL